MAKGYLLVPPGTKDPVTTADLDIMGRCLTRIKRLHEILEAECDLNDHMEKVQQIALEALEDILESPVENSHGLARIALDRIKALQ